MAFRYGFSRIVQGALVVVLAGLPIGVMGCDSGSGPGDPGDRPAAPSSVQATSQDGAVALTWTASASATGYNVYRSTSSFSGTTGEPVNGDSPVDETAYTDDTAENGTRYYYRVTTVDDAGESNPSAEVSARPFPSPPDRPEE